MYLKKLTLFTLIMTMFFSVPIYTTYADETNNAENDSKVVYLTFDDGPAGKVTNDVLDIL
ncbi:MAG: polysaccharide deacetylase, partial [Clostridium butyricum]|nr:polysaccharide deacetylase [Clostridium butyricum]